MSLKGFKPLRTESKMEIRIARAKNRTVRIFFNKDARKKINGEYVGVFIDAEKKALAFQPTKEPAENTLRLIGKGTVSIPATKLLKIIALAMPGKKIKERYEVEWLESDKAMVWRL